MAYGIVHPDLQEPLYLRDEDETAYDEDAAYDQWRDDRIDFADA